MADVTGTREDLRVVRSLLPLLWRWKLNLVVQVAASIILVAVVGLGPLLMGSFVGQLAGERSAAGAYSGTGAVLAGIAIVTFVARTARRYLGAIDEARSEGRVQAAALDRLLACPLDEVIARGSVYWQTRVEGDSRRVLSFLPHRIAPLVEPLVVLVVALAMGLWISWPVTLAVVVAQCLAMLPTAWLARRRRQLQSASTELQRSKSVALGQALRTFPLVKLSVAEEYERRRVGSYFDRIGALALWIERRRLADRFLRRAIAVVAPATLAVASLVAFRAGALDVDSTVAVGLYAGAAMRGIRGAANLPHALDRAFDAAHGLRLVLDLPSERTGSERGARPLATIARIETIELQGVWFRYPVLDLAEERLARTAALSRGGRTRRPATPGHGTPGPWVLQGVDLRLEAGSVTAIVGASGMGKSTIVKLLSGLYTPTEGRILVNGIDLARIDPHSYRRAFAAVAHEDFLLDEPLEDNLLYRRRAEGAQPGPVEQEVELGEGARRTTAADVDAIIAALRLERVADRDRCRVAGLLAKFEASGLHEGRMELPRDLVLSAPLSVSAGERQRIAIGRQLLHGARSWFLDEATGNLDGSLEELVLESIRERSDGVLLLISHRLACIRRADVVHVLAEGRIVESGAPEELARRGDEFQRLFRSQLGPAPDSGASRPLLEVRL